MGAFNTQTIRVVTIDNAPWFVAADVCRVLDLAKTDRAVNPLDCTEKGTHRVRTPGGPQPMSIISESGLFKLIMRSDKPQAKPFQDWVAKVVLPAIRKDGAYVMGEEKVASGEMSPTLEVASIYFFYAARLAYHKSLGYLHIS